MKLLFMNDIGVNIDSANLMSFYTLKDYYPYEVWDLSPIFDKVGTVKNIKEAVSINSIEDFEKRLADCVKIENTLIITNMVEMPWKKLAPIAKKYGVKVISTQKNNFTDILYSHLAFDFSIKMPLKTRIKCIIQKFRISRTLLNVIKKKNVRYDYQISAYNSKPETVKHFIRTHNVKYDEYLANFNSENIIGGKYILFIDSSVCYHPIDYKEFDPNFDKEHYLKQLNSYFDLIEKKYNLSVIIALHPVSINVLSSEDFGGRKILYGKTTQLIHNAEFVISHFSTSLINVVLAKKAACIISSKEIESSIRYRNQMLALSFAKMCGFQIDSLDSNKLPTPNIDERKYKNFINKFIVNDKKVNTSNAEILLDLLQTLETNY